MSTRGIVAVPYAGRGTDSEHWHGRYVHSDSYPTWLGRQLWALVAREGVERVRQVLTDEHYGWSSIGVLDGFEPLSRGHDDGRFANVPGYGVAYTTERGQSSPLDWLTRNDPGDADWAYVLRDDGLQVYVCRGKPISIGTYPWAGGEPDWEFMGGG